MSEDLHFCKFFKRSVQPGLFLGLLLGSIDQVLADDIPKLSPIAPESRGVYQGRPVVYASFVEEGPKVDGDLSDEVWQMAKPAGDLIQYYPGDNVKPSQNTEFRVLYDKNNLYVAAWCFQDDPKGITANTMGHTSAMYSDDLINITLDTFQDKRNGYMFLVTPTSSRSDLLIADNRDLNDDWDTAWMAKSQIHTWGWGTELVIPFESIAFDEKAESWGFNFYRGIKKTNEHILWANARPSMHSFDMSQAGELRGLKGLSQGLGLDLMPYAIGKYRNRKSNDDEETDFDGGLDIRYRLTPSLTSQLSLNTEFAETEADIRQVNFTRYPLFFPEKRAFFLEDANIFEFSSPGVRSWSRRASVGDIGLKPYFSRRIGLNRDGEIVPVHVAAKVTGRVKDYNIGLMDLMLEGDDHPRNAFVGRVSRNLSTASSVGLLSTVGDPNSDQENASIGIDYKFHTSEFLGKNVLQAKAFALGTYAEQIPETGLEPAFGMSGIFDSRDLEISASFTEVSRYFEPAMGFVSRRDIRNYSTGIYYKPRYENSTWLMSSRHGYELDLYTDLGNNLINTTQTFNLLHFGFNSLDSISLHLMHYTDRAEQDFPISDGTVIKAGDYEWWAPRISLNSASHRPISASLALTLGEMYEADATEYDAYIHFKFWKQFSFGGYYTINEVDWHHARQSDIQVSRAYATISINSDCFITNMLQYDNITDSIGVNSRLQWEYKPGAKVYFVVNQGYLDEMTGLALSDYEIILKIGGIFRF